MWNKLSLRIKITVLTILTLTALCGGLTAAAILNTSIFYDPIAYVIDKKPLGAGYIGEGFRIENDNENTITAVDEIYIGSQNQFKMISILTAAGVVVIGSFFAWVLTGKTLKPLRTFADRIEDINENSLNEKVVLPQSSSEVSRLTKSFNRMLKELNGAFNNKKLFASHAAHELKTPLTNIITNIEVMQMDDDPGIDDYREVIEIIKDNAERLTVLIQDLLHFSAELDSGNFSNIETDTLFEKIFEDLSPFLREKNIEVHIEGRAVIFGDKNLLERAFFNLIQNAIKYNTENGSIIIISDKNTIAVEDTGIGIPKECLPQIFEPFYCVDKSRSRKLGGSGLGLSITKQIFDNHSLKISVSSEMGKGTKFLITLPALS